MEFPSKILLCGEYGLVLGGSGLAIPYSKYSGQLNYSSFSTMLPEKLVAEQSHHSIVQLFKYITRNSSQFGFLDLTQFGNDIDKGLWFDSTITKGYGLGSSGALVASIYNRYVNDTCADLSQIKNRLASIESYFHGSSSGVDPLVSFVKQPLILHGIGAVEVLADWSISQLGLSVFLVDTGEKSKTISLVDWFKAQMTKPDFKKQTEENFFKVNNQLIKKIRSNEPADMHDLLTISRYQLDYLSSMVPVAFRSHFYEGLKNGEFALKLCGSGGGGFMLCYAKDENKVIDYFLTKAIAHQKIF